MFSRKYVRLILQIILLPIAAVAGKDCDNHISNSAYADAPAATNNPQIEACRKISQAKFDSGINATMRNGYQEYAQCLEKTIFRLAKEVFPEEQQKELHKKLKKLSEAYGSFYYSLYNENKWCDCGTFGMVRSDTQYPLLLERIITDMQALYDKEHPNDEVTSKQSKTSENLPSNIIDSVREQFEQCWEAPTELGEIPNLASLLLVKLSKDGKVTSVSLSKEQTRYKSDPNFRAVTDSAIKAVNKCNTIKGLPSDKYELWKEMELTFDPAGHP